jgi:hypothetical protein
VPKACFLSLAIRRRSVWISWSWARIVAGILAFSACKATIIAFGRAASSARVAASFHMGPTATDQAGSP